MNNAYYGIVILVALLVLWRRTRNMYRPIKGNGARMLWPVLFLTPGVFLILNPEVHVNALEIMIAAGMGIILSIPLIWTTSFEMREDQHIYAKKNIGFIIAFVGVLIFRFVLRSHLPMLDPQSKAALFMIVAMGYIIPWRIVTFYKFRMLKSQLAAEI